MGSRIGNALGAAANLPSVARGGQPIRRGLGYQQSATCSIISKIASRVGVSGRLRALRIGVSPFMDIRGLKPSEYDCGNARPLGMLECGHACAVFSPLLDRSGADSRER